jgi:hypothetical protein
MPVMSPAYRIEQHDWSRIAEDLSAPKSSHCARAMR